jgi:hypothetical protein
MTSADWEHLCAAFLRGMTEQELRDTASALSHQLDEFSLPHYHHAQAELDNLSAPQLAAIVAQRSKWVADEMDRLGQ